MSCREIDAHLSGFFFAMPVEKAVHHGDQRQAGIVRKRMMVGDARLRERPGLRLGWITEGRERHRQNTHGGSISGVAFRKRAFHGAMRDIAADAAAAGIANIGRPGFQPCREFFAHVPCIEVSAPNHRAAERQRHLGIVGHLSGLEPQPAAARDFAVDAILRGDLALGHELDRGAKSITDGKAKKRGQSPVFDSQGGHPRPF